MANRISSMAQILRMLRKGAPKDRIPGLSQEVAAMNYDDHLQGPDIDHMTPSGTRAVRALTQKRLANPDTRADGVALLRMVTSLRRPDASGNLETMLMKRSARRGGKADPMLAAILKRLSRARR